MNVNSLPNEIFKYIFSQLEAKDIYTCREVCRRWKDLVDSLEDMWKRMCYREFWCSQESFEKTSLCWREMYRSLAMWSKFWQATMTARQMCGPNHNHRMKIMKNNVIALILNSSQRVSNYHDLVIYYDLDTLKELYCIRFGFLFEQFNENEHLVTAVHEEGYLCVVPKKTNKQFHVGLLSEGAHGGYQVYTLFEKEVWFKNSDNIICVSKLVKKKGVLIIETTELDDFEDNVVAFSYLKNELYILTDEGTIYMYKEGELVTAVQIDVGMGHSIICKLWTYGFDYTSENVYHWLRTQFDKKVIHITMLNATAIHKHGKIIVLGTATGMLNIYVNPYNSAAELKLYGTNPNLSIDMRNYGLYQINQLDILEMRNGHRLIVTAANRVVILEFKHKMVNLHAYENTETTDKQNSKKTLRKKVPKKSNVKKVCPKAAKKCVKVNNLGKVVKAKVRKQVVKHKYMTRSAAKNKKSS